MYHLEIQTIASRIKVYRDQRNSLHDNKKSLTQKSIFARLVKEFQVFDRNQFPCNFHKSSLKKSNLH